MWHVWGEWEGACRASVWKSDKKRTLGRPRHRWEDNIIMDLLEVEWWAGTELRDNWQAIVNVVMNLQVP
jgi:hypothetical protein